MSETTAQLDAEATASEVTVVAPEVKTFDADYVKKLRDEAAGYRVKLKEFEDSQKTEAQRLQDQLTELSDRAQKAERERSRLTVLAGSQIPAEYHDLVQGDDAESLEASAGKVRALLESKVPADRASFVIPDEGGSPALALNGDGIESALKKALGIA